MTTPAGSLNSFDRVAGVYDASRGFPPGVDGKVAEGLSSLVREAGGRRLLEVGVGTGRVAVPLAARGLDVTGLDISRGMLDVLRAKAPEIDVVIAEAARQPFRPGSFDAVLFVHILHLVPDVAATLRESLRVVRPGGLMLSGRTHHEDSVGRRATAVIQRVTQEITGIEPRRGGWRQYERIGALFREMMEEMHATFREVEVARWVGYETARKLLDETSEQTHSHTWSIPTEAIPEIVRRATPEVVEIFGGLDTPAPEEQSFVVTVARLGQ